MRSATTRCRLLGRCLLPALLLLLTLPVRAQEPAQAGLVVQYSEDRVETRCLQVAAEGTNGVDLLNASGLEVVSDVSSGMGVSVCQIEGQGCAYPAQHCFCQCMGGGDCGYWNYFYREPGAETWTYSPLGAVLRTVSPGSVEAWVWGDGHTPPAEALTFEAICQAPEPVATEVAVATATPAPIGEASPATTAPRATASSTVTLAAPAGVTPAIVAETAASPAGGESATAPARDGTGSVAGYVAFGAMLLLLAAVGVVTWLRRP